MRGLVIKTVIETILSSRSIQSDWTETKLKVFNQYFIYVQKI